MARHREFFRICSWRRTYDREAGKFTFNISYETAAPEPSERVVTVAEAFGLGLDKWEKFVLYDNVQLKIGPADIVYLTGDSGSGKSVLLKAILKDLGEEAADINDVSLEASKPLIETVGKTVEEGLELLSRVGLNDAFLFLRSYEQLSDGQKYRYRLAKLLESQKQWWLMDEFAATLDRDTAKIVAYNLQKLARKEGRAVIAATTHTDLLEDLAPSVHIHKRYGKEISIDYHPNKPARECSLLREMHVREGTYDDWKQLAGFHYRSHRVAFTQKVFALSRQGTSEVCGVIVYTTPQAACMGRSKAFQPKNMAELNEKLTRISRVVVHPKYRTISAGAKLVRESLPRCGKPMVETLAVMARYNPFFERAGMTRMLETKPAKEIVELVESLHTLGFNPAFLGVAALNLKQIQGKACQVKEQLAKMRYPYTRRLAGAHGNFTMTDYRKWLSQTDETALASALTRLAQLNQAKVYLFWQKTMSVSANMN